MTRTPTVFIDGENIQERDLIEPVLKEFANRIGKNITVSNPHGERRDPYSGRDFDLCIYFWCSPIERTERDQLSCAYGYFTQRDQGDSFDLSVDWDETDGVRIVDPEGNNVALIVGTTLYILFDLPHEGHGGEINNADKMLKLILEDYYLYFTDKTRFDKVMQERFRPSAERKFLRAYREVLVDRTSHSLEYTNAKIADIKERLQWAVGERKKLLCHDIRAPIDDAKILEVYRRLCKLSVTGTVRMIYDGICVPVGQIDIEYDDVVYDIGEFDVVVNFIDAEVSCINRTRIIAGEYHPHVDMSGNCCLGDASEGIELLMKAMEAEAVVLIMIEFLKSYSDDNPFEEIESWPIKQVLNEKETNG